MDEKALQDDDLLARKALLLGTRQLANEFAELANLGDRLARRWVFRLHRYGTTLALLSMVDKIVCRVEAISTYQLDKETGKFVMSWDVWSNSLKEKPIFPNRETIFAWIVMRLINDDIAETLKLCEARAAGQSHMTDSKAHMCPNYFFGRPNKHWCSKKCGSRMRVAKIRNED